MDMSSIKFFHLGAHHERQRRQDTPFVLPQIREQPFQRFAIGTLLDGDADLRRLRGGGVMTHVAQ
jgi:hypothetical protein